MRIARLLLVPLLVATSYGCLDPLGPNDVDLSFHTQYVQRTKIDRVADKTGESVVALVPGDGGWETRDLVHRGQDGRFAIPEVPEGRYFLRTGDPSGAGWLDFHDTDARVAKYEPRVLGAPTDGIPAAASLTVTSENANGYQGSGTVCLTSIAAGIGGICSGWVPNPNAYGLDLTLDFAKQLAPYYPNADLIRKGDDVIVHQLDWTTVNDGSLYGYATTARGVGVADLDMSADPSFAATMVEVDQDKTLDVSVDRAKFEAQWKEGHPQAVSWSHDVSVELALQVSGGAMFVGGTAPWVLFAYYEPGSFPADVYLPYGNPLSAPWTPVVRVYSYGGKKYQVPTSSGTLAEPYYRVVGSSVEYLASATPGTLAPVLGPPSQIAIDGRPFFEDGPISAAPELSWSAPKLGTADTYLLRLYEMYESAGVTRSRLIARFHTRQTSLKLPPLVAPGKRVAFLLSAETGNLDPKDAVVTHSASGLPSASGFAASGLMRVQ